MARRSRHGGRNRSGRTSKRSGFPRIPRRFRLNRLLVAGIDPQTGQPTHGFETKRNAKNEDIKRVRLITADIRRIRREGFPKTNEVDDQPLIDLNEARRLRKTLKKGVRTGNPSPILGSSMYMRQLRRSVIGALLQAVEPYPDEELRTVTVINKQWAYHANQLNNVSAATIKRQFRTHLERMRIPVKADGHSI